HGRAAADVQPHADRALVQVGLAVGGGGGQAHHGHQRVAAEDDHADVRHALEGVVGKAFVELDQGLDDGHVRRAAERVQPGQDVGDVALDVVTAHACAAGLDVFPAVDALDDQNALAAAALGWLDDEARTALHHARYALDLE